MTRSLKIKACWNAEVCLPKVILPILFILIALGVIGKTTTFFSMLLTMQLKEGRISSNICLVTTRRQIIFFLRLLMDLEPLGSQLKELPLVQLIHAVS